MHGMGHGSHWNPPRKEEVLRKVLEYEIILKAEAWRMGKRRWNVYLNIPDEWVLGRDYSESELECDPLFNDNSDATSVDELSDVVAPSLPVEEEIVPVKRRCASKRIQRGTKRK
ncbi:uncharacterized protein BJ212DRAFT_1306956 [Suillus subaureus]|uniref:Uncharacterized protein n=1 Tax=Suillus subaureus TaxID=48587 RepID=A0A9P7AS86_9AGAM|nr:uncharacterized protein BJ212DRAFT_1306956 [Suillus subaureus]KAG1794033.1 hypothetical protein BJ212DRAFT_1306956 [Suillus subaureus]